MVMESKTKNTTGLSKTNSGNSKRFLHCFRQPELDVNAKVSGSVRPVDGCTDGLSHDHKPVFTCVDMGDKQGVVFLSDDGGGGGGNDKEQQNGAVKKKKGGGGHRGRKLLLMMRAVMFETSLAKKIRKKKQKKQKQRQQSDGNLLNNGNHMQQESSEDEHGREEVSRYDSSSAITSSSACSSSLSSNSRYQSDRNVSFRSNTSEGSKQKNREGCCGFNNTTGLCFLIVSLFVLVFWGKVSAIVCTTTCFFLVPRRWSSTTSGNNGKLCSRFCQVRL